MILLTLAACHFSIELSDDSAKDPFDTGGGPVFDETGDEVDSADSGEVEDSGEPEETAPPAETGSEDSDADPDPACPLVSGVYGLGTSWSYGAAYSSYGTTTRTVEVTAFDGTSVETTDITTYDGGSERTVTTYVYDYTCDDSGMWLNASSYEYEAFTESGTTTNTHSEIFQPSVLIYPADVYVGLTWDSDYAGVVTAYDGSTSPAVPYTTSHQVVSEDAVSVPFGAVTAWQVGEFYKGGSGGWTTWYGDGLGFVADMNWELESYAP